MAHNQKANLLVQLEHTLQGRICFMGVGNPQYGDDAVGVELAQRLIQVGLPDVIVADTSPDRYLGDLSDKGFDHLVFLDALDFGASPGSVVFLDSQHIKARYPQISTHKISLGVLANFVESGGVTKAWLLGVQPESLKEGQGMTPSVQKTMGLLFELLFHMRKQEIAVC